MTSNETTGPAAAAAVYASVAADDERVRVWFPFTVPRVDDGGSESADGDLERIDAWCLAEGPDTDRCRWSGALGGRVGYGPATGTDTDRKRYSRNRVSILVLHDKRWLDGQRQSGVERPA